MKSFPPTWLALFGGALWLIVGPMVGVSLLAEPPVTVRAERHDVYLSVPGAKRIEHYEQDARTGQLHRREGVTTSGEAAALAISPNRRFLFASYRPEGQLAAFRRDPETGRLALINVVDAGIDPAHLAVDRSGRWLFAAYYVAAKVTVHRIGEDGSLSTRPIVEVPTVERAHAVVLDPTDHFLFVPHTGPNQIFQFRWDAGRGELTANQPAVVRLPESTGPRHGAFHPTLPVVYINHEQGNRVETFAFDTDRGTLQSRGAVSTLPSDFRQTNATAELKVHPSGRFVYCANRGHHSIARFGVDPNSGELTALGQSLTEPTPRSFDIDPTGQFLYAAGESSGKLAGYRIDDQTGDLERFATWDIGPRLWWVLAVSGSNQPQP